MFKTIFGQLFLGNEHCSEVFVILTGHHFNNCPQEEYTRYTEEKNFINCFEEEYTEYTTTTQTHVVLCSNLLS